MSSVEMGNRLRELHRAIMSEGISLHAALYHHRLLDYRPDERATLLEEQRRVSRSSAATFWLFDRLNSFVDARLANDAKRCFPAVEELQTKSFVQLR